MKISAIIILLILLTSATQLQSQEIKVVDFESFQPYLQKNNDDTVYVINFWATWCVPCVKEMPYFTKARREYTDEKIKFLLVSLDFPQNIKSRVIPFIEKHKIQAEVIVLDDPNANSWIDKVNPSWSGALPATVVYKNEQKSFHEGEITYKQLTNLIEPKL